MHSAGTIRNTEFRSNIAPVGPRVGWTRRAAALALCALTVALASALITARPAYAQTESVLHSFGVNDTDGYNPYSGLVTDTLGNLYGTNYVGGSGYGTVFKITPSGTLSVLHSFGRADGANPYLSKMVRDKAGNLYGTTIAGGANDIGTVFKVTPTGVETVLHSFASDGKDGYRPYTGLAIDGAGNLYGTTYSGGASNYGTVFKVTPSGTETVVYSFKGGTDGCNPYGNSVVLRNGFLYGATAGCGAHAVGTVFKLTKTGTETVLHSFANDGVDGFTPYAGLVFDKLGNLYGTTYVGGVNGYGTVFKITPSGTETVLHSFAFDGTDGFNPYAGLVLDKLGNFYGTTVLGGVNNLGTAFKLTPAGTLSVLHSFANDGTDGFYPFAGLVLGKKGILYGATYEGGSLGYGTVFKIVP